jgi:hypothetical protein
MTNAYHHAQLHWLRWGIFAQDGLELKSSWSSPPQYFKKVFFTNNVIHTSVAPSSWMPQSLCSVRGRSISG